MIRYPFHLPGSCVDFATNITYKALIRHFSFNGEVYDETGNQLTLTQAGIAESRVWNWQVRRALACLSTRRTKP